MVIAGGFLKACEILLDKGLHANMISEGFQNALEFSLKTLKNMSLPIDIADKETLLECVNTSLSSKVVSAYSEILSPIAIDAVMRVINPKTATNVDLKDIKVVKKLGGTIDDTELVEGLVFESLRPNNASGAPTKMVNAKIALIQFQIATPKTDIENSVLVRKYEDMDRIMKEERKIIAGMVKKIEATGVNVLLIQKSILKDATNELSLHFLAKKGIMVVQDVERNDVEFISKTIGAVPIAHIDNMTPEKFGFAELCEEVRLGDDSKIFKITGVKNNQTVSVLTRGSNGLVLDEAERSLHDALCVLRSLVKSKALMAGGGAPEVEIAQKLREHATTVKGPEALVFKAYAEALEIIPYTLAENAGKSLLI